MLVSDEVESCVKFSRNSWHRKLYKKVYGKHSLTDHDYERVFDREGNSKLKLIRIDRQINLCPYMRKIVWSMVLYPFLMIWRSLPESWQWHQDEGRAISIFAILCIIAHILINTQWDVWYAWVLGFFGGLGIAFGIYGLIILAERIKEKMDYRGSDKLSKTKGLFTTYLHSNHKKICPCVEFVGEEKND